MTESVSFLTTEVQNDLDVSVVWVLLSQRDVGGRGTLSTGVCVCSQCMRRALQSCKEIKGSCKLFCEYLFNMSQLLQNNVKNSFMTLICYSLYSQDLCFWHCLIIIFCNEIVHCYIFRTIRLNKED